MTNTLFVALEDVTARDIVKEAGKKDNSDNTVVRAVIDNRLGYASLARTFPADSEQEKILRLETNRDINTVARILADVPGVKAFSTSFEDLSSAERPGQRALQSNPAVSLT